MDRKLLSNLHLSRTSYARYRHIICYRLIALFQSRDRTKIQFDQVHLRKIIQNEKQFFLDHVHLRKIGIFFTKINTTPQNFMSVPGHPGSHGSVPGYYNI